MEDTFYAQLYEAHYLDAGVVVYKPIKLINGYFDEEKEIFIDDEGRQYLFANMAYPCFGQDSDHLVDAIDGEIDNEEPKKRNGEKYVAFPIAYEKLQEMFKESELSEKEILEVYERNIRSYLMYATYDEKMDELILHLADKINDEVLITDVTLDIAEVFEQMISSEIDELGKGLITFVTSIGEGFGYDSEEEYDEEEDVSEYMMRNGKKVKKEESAFKEINYDIDPDELEKNVTSEVIGQDHVAKALVSMIYKNKRYHDHSGLKSNMLILGPSGCGKTELARSIQRHTGIPTVFFDASSASASGYVGNSVTQAIRDLLTTCGGDLELAENGIIVIDEIDKLTGGEGISKGDVQDELFKMLEGDEITVSAESYHDTPFRFNPKNVTFIGCGAAQNLIEKKKKEKTKVAIGFGQAPAVNPNAEEEEVVIEPEDLIKYGFKPELLRRFPIIKVVKNLSQDKLVNILTKSKISNLKLYEEAFNDVDHVKLICDKDVLEEIASRAMKEKAGASGLKRVVDDMLQVAVRKIRLLNGESGELRILKETLDNPEKFQLYKLSSTSDEKELVYPPQEEAKVKVKKASN